MDPLPVGKLPPELLARLLSENPSHDRRVRLASGVGLDCAVVEPGKDLLVFKTDPITFATDEIGWYAIQVNANDLATCGATPRWLLACLLLPQGATTEELAERITRQVYSAAEGMGIAVIGGHTEITHGLDHPILVGTLVGEVAPDRLVTPRGAKPGDRLLLTKGVPIEATALLAREFPERLAGALSEEEIRRAQGYLHDPGIGVTRDARVALGAGRVTAMHDPTEGGLLGALWELAEASGRGLLVDLRAAPVSEVSRKTCAVFGLDPLATLASGALLLAADSGSAGAIQRALEGEGIPCAEIGQVREGPVGVWEGERVARRPQRDEIGKVF